MPSPNRNGTLPLRRLAGIVGALIAAVVAIAALAIYFGAYDVAADVPHTSFVYWLLDTTRDRSITVRAADVKVPSDLIDAQRVAAGAGLYGEMCSSCHLAPGMEKTEISQGLYPQAPELAKGTDMTPAEEFWIIKHGIKMTGMAAWGKTHNDTLIWDMVAFLQKLPSLSAAQYTGMVKNAPEEHEELMHEQGAHGGS